MSLSLYRLDNLRETDLLIISTESTVLAGYDLVGTQWRLSEFGFENRDELRCPVLADGVVAFGCIGSNRKKIFLTITNHKLTTGDWVVFRPAQIVVSIQYTGEGAVPQLTGPADK